MKLFFLLMAMFSEAASQPLLMRSEKIPEGMLKIPIQASQKKLPALLIFGGFETGGGVLEILHPHEPLILATVDYPYDGDRRFRFPNSLMDGLKLRRSIPNMQKAIKALVDHLKSRKDVDPNRIAIVGASFGAPYSIRAAALNSDLNALILVHGFADIKGTIEYRLTNIWAGQLGFFSSWASWMASHLIVGFLDPPIPEDDARQLRSTQLAIMIEASEDTLIPTSSRELLWKSLSESHAKVKRIRMPGDHLRPGSDALIEKIMNLSIAELKKQGWF